jgi:hypothetical protein
MTRIVGDLSAIDRDDGGLGDRRYSARGFFLWRPGTDGIIGCSRFTATGGSVDCR